MGFTWSLWIAQEITRSRAVAPDMTAASEINSHYVDNTFKPHSEKLIVYVDGIAVFGSDKARVDGAMNRIISVLGSRV